MVLLNNIGRGTNRCITNDLFHRDGSRLCRVKVSEILSLILEVLGLRCQGSHFKHDATPWQALILPYVCGSNQIREFGKLPLSTLVASRAS